MDVLITNIDLYVSNAAGARVDRILKQHEALGGLFFRIDDEIYPEEWWLSVMREDFEELIRQLAEAGVTGEIELRGDEPDDMVKYVLKDGKAKKMVAVIKWVEEPCQT